MSISSSIRDQAYQFFIEEAPELLQILESGLLNLRQERSTAKVHDLMRAAHSLKGGAASVGLDAIQVIAHRLEDILKALYSDAVTVDTALEGLFLQAYDCLKLPLMEHITMGDSDPLLALAEAEPIFAQLEALLGDVMAQTETFIPSSVDLGVDMVVSIFEVDVGEGLERLQRVLANPQDYEVAGELRAQAEVFQGFAELLDLPGFGDTAQAAIKGLDTHPHEAVLITQLALADFKAARAAVLTGERDHVGGPSTELVALGDLRREVLCDAVKDSIPRRVETELYLEKVESEACSVDEAASSETIDILVGASSGDWDPPQSMEEESLPAESTRANSTLDTEPLIASYDEKVSVDSIPLIEDPLIEDIFGDSDFLTEHREDLFLSLESLEGSVEGAIADRLEGHKDDPDFIPQTELSEDLHTDYTLEAANSKLDEIFKGLAVESAAGAAYEAAGMGATDEMTDYGDIVISVSGEFEAESELDEPLVLDDVQEITEEIITEEITDYIDIVIPTESELNSGGDSDEQSIQEGVENVAAYVDFVIPPNQAGTVVSTTDQPITSESVDEADVETLSLTPPLASQSYAEPPETIAEAVCSVEQIFEDLPPVETVEGLLTEDTALTVSEYSPPPQGATAGDKSLTALTVTQGGLIRQKTPTKQGALAPETNTPSPNLSVRVDLDRLGRMDNLLGELTINRNGLALQNEQLQRSVRELVYRFDLFKRLTGSLQDLSDQMLIDPERNLSPASGGLATNSKRELQISSTAADFDSLELDSYGALHGLIRDLLEEVMLLEESVGDVELFAGRSNQMLDRQRKQMTQLRNELMWARMLPLGGVFDRFPRILRDLSATYHKPVELKISGGGVLVDKAVLEKLYTPLLHLLRNAFDHGVEGPETRVQQGKAEWGQIEISAYHQSNTTVIEVRDDGRGLDLEKIGRRAVTLGLLSDAQLAIIDKKQLAELIFSPGFSTASQVSELSGRGVGLDVVRSQLKSLKGTICVTPFPGQGTTFTLRLPLTLTIAKLLICLIGSTALAIPSDSISEIVIPKADQIKRSGSQRLLYWQDELVPVYAVADLLDQTYPLPETLPSKSLSAVPTPQNWASPILVIRQEQTVFALEIERLVTEQELVIKPFSTVIVSPSYTYGCTILGDGSLVPVIDGAALLDFALGSPSSPSLNAIAPGEEGPLLVVEHSQPILEGETPKESPKGFFQTSTILVVDDSAALRRTLALTLQKAGYHVLQARDGKEALDQLQQSTRVRLIICDVEMPNMNGFEFLHHRRQDPQINAIPVAMLTSRGNPKHRRLAMHLGANQYFTKPYVEQTFLGEIRNMLERQMSGIAQMLT
ncbi:MAG: response regulator [Leptolyngbyaceae cyanobacterium MO_188.B28]|nr:response regulator [Leptolyngbyaceae cyanobacterium MO_188.B28]